MDTYFDHAATSWPKKSAVIEAVSDYLRTSAANPGRSAHRVARQAAEVVERTRLKLARLLGISDHNRLVWTSGCTAALNTALFGVLNPGDRILQSPLEHNAVARPLEFLSQVGCEVETLAADSVGRVDLRTLETELKRLPTRLVAINHGSNVNGVVQDLGSISALCHEHGTLLLVDGAQTVGYVPIDVEGTGIDLLAFPGHKGLGGPTGIGALYVGAGVEIRPTVFGGTGAASESPTMPTEFPQMLEAGTLNGAAIAGLEAALSGYEANLQSLTHTLEELREWVKKLQSEIESIRFFAALAQDDHAAVPVISLEIDAWDCHDLAAVLDSSFEIASRAGLHCAPAAHRHFGTLDSGLLRLSFSHSVTSEQLDFLTNVLRQIAGVSKA